MISPSLRQRLQVPVSASTPQRAVPMDTRRRLKQMDIYRKVPVDLTETSRGGLLATLVSVLALVLLAGMELGSLFRPITETSIGINQDQSSMLRVHVNLTLMGIACEFVSVDLENKLGVSRFAIETSTLVKVSNGQVVGKMQQIKRESATRSNTLPPTIPAASNRSRLEVVSLLEWERMVQTSRIPLLVNLYSSNNSTHSSEFHSVFERAAEQAMVRGADMAFASLDCVQFKQVCEWEHVQAYPSVRLFVPGGAGKSKVYTGGKDLDALVQFAMMPTVAQVRDNTKACDVQGYLDVARVPGKLSIHANALDADLDHQIITSNHVLHWLGFGKDFVTGDNGIEFYGDKQFYTHYLKIVSTKGPQQPLMYEYSLATDWTAGDNSTGVDFVFDISPLQITTTRKRKDLIQGVTAMLALLGGVFSASFMIQGVLQVLLCWTFPTSPTKQH